jgi:hypothetical protein
VAGTPDVNGEQAGQRLRLSGIGAFSVHSCCRNSYTCTHTCVHTHTHTHTHTKHKTHTHKTHAHTHIHTHTHA